MVGRFCKYSSVGHPGTLGQVESDASRQAAAFRQSEGAKRLGELVDWPPLGRRRDRRFASFSRGNTSGENTSIRGNRHVQRPAGNRCQGILEETPGGLAEDALSSPSRDSNGPASRQK